jgi:hypothetical protein
MMACLGLPATDDGKEFLVQARNPLWVQGGLQLLRELELILIDSNSRLKTIPLVKFGLICFFAAASSVVTDIDFGGRIAAISSDFFWPAPLHFKGRALLLSQAAVTVHMTFGSVWQLNQNLHTTSGQFPPFEIALAA